MVEKESPSQEEIERICSKIRSEWSPAKERQRRLVPNPETWTVPFVILKPYAGKKGIVEDSY